jgi:hypothetical protein
MANLYAIVGKDREVKPYRQDGFPCLLDAREYAEDKGGRYKIFAHLTDGTWRQVEFGDCTRHKKAKRKG